MQNLKTIVIGCGAIAREHLKALRSMPSARIEAVCDLSAARAESTADRFQVSRWGTDYRELIEATSPSVVHITTPPSSHVAIASYCLGRGINVLCEKPVALSSVEFDQLSELARSNNCSLVENQNLRLHSSVAKINDLIASGQFGEVVHVDIFFSLPLVAQGSPYTDPNAPHFGANLPGGVIGDFLPHIAYLSIALAGTVSEVRTLWSNRSNRLFAADEFRAILKGERCSATVGFSATSNVSGYWIRVLGSEMHAEADLLEPPRIVYKKHRNGEPAVMSVVDGISESWSVFTGSFSAFFRKLAGTSSYDGLDSFVARFYEALSGTAALPVSLAEVRESVGLVERLTSQGSRL